MPIKSVIKNKDAGHRARLRERFMKSGLDAFADHEIIELLLTLGTPLRDCKQMARDVLARFKTIPGVLDASVDELRTIRGIGPMNALGIRLYHALTEKFAKLDMPRRITLDSAREVAEYLQKKIGNEKKEHFVVLYLNTRNQLVHEEIVSVGTINASLVHPQEVFKPAIDHRATHIIVAHNHPSGTTDPSQADIMLTGRLADAGTLLGITLQDHLIVTKDSFLSIK